MGPMRTPIPVFNEMEKILPEDSEIALVEFSEQFILFSPYPVTHFGYHTPTDIQLQAANQWLEGQGTRYLLLAEPQLQASCFNPDLAEYVGFAHRRDWYVVNAKAKTNLCTLPAQPVQEYSR